MSTPEQIASEVADSFARHAHALDWEDGPKRRAYIIQAVLNGIQADRAQRTTTQASASDRYQAAREVLAGYDNPEADRQPTEADLADALRALIEPPSVGEGEEQIIDRVIAEFERETGFYNPPAVMVGVRNWLSRGINAGIQAANESWEPDDYRHIYGED